MTTTLFVNTKNPAEYLGACGFFEVASYLYPKVQAYWVQEGLCLTSMSAEQFNQVVGVIDNLKLREVEELSAEGEPLDPKVRTFDLVNEDCRFALRMNWWEDRTTLVDGNSSSWKCIAGQMVVSRTTQSLIDACASLDGITQGNILSVGCRLSGRLNFNPLSAWDGLSVGFSPNELGSKILKETMTFPYSELLTSVALQTFAFKKAHRRQSTYYTWGEPIPVEIARFAAASPIPGLRSSRFIFSKVSRGQGSSGFSWAKEA
jgi:CRISPR-associated protein Csb3